MTIDKRKIKRGVFLFFPYIIVALLATNIGEALRMSEGSDLLERSASFFFLLSPAFINPLPSLHLYDFMVGILCSLLIRLAVYLKGRNAKKYRHNVEYGSARWGNKKDIEPYMDPVFAKNIILTKTEWLMMSNRPKNPAHARNKNVLIVGGSGSGKTRFWIKPNLLQLYGSYVLTDPNG